jgi:hypothetical protein
VLGLEDESRFGEVIEFLEADPEGQAQVTQGGVLAELVV